MIQRQATGEPDAVAIAAPGRRPLTYDALRDRVQRTVETLNAMGIGRNDRVAIVMPQGPEMAVAILAVAAGATAAPLNPAARARELDADLGGLNATALVVSSELESVARDVARKRGLPSIELAAQHDGPAGAFALTGDAGRPRTAPAGLAGPDDIAFVLRTSGTTSRPKVVPLTHERVCRSARSTSTALGLTTQDRCLGVMPLFHIHGLVGALLASLAAGGRLISAPTFSTPEFFERIESCRPTWYTAVPMMHQTMLAYARTHPKAPLFHTLRLIRSCSTALSPRLMEELERVFEVPVVEAYGMTEAAHEVSCNPLPPLARKAGSVGVATGADVAILDANHQLLPPGRTGAIVVKGPSVVAGYDDPTDDDRPAFSDGWFRTGDQGHLDEDGYLFITGRTKEMINRGGEKVAPREVEAVVLEHPAVSETVAFAVPHPELGEEVAAAVVLRPGLRATSSEIQLHASARLAEFKVPRQVVFLDEIPRGPTGKPVRIGLAALLHMPTAGHLDRRGEASPTMPRTPLEETLIHVWAEALGAERVDVHDNFFELGGHSLQLAQILTEVRRHYGVDVPPEALFMSPTIAGLADQVEAVQRDSAQATTDQSGLLVRLRGGDGNAFFLVPGGGGGVQEFVAYGKLIYLLNTGRPVYGVRARGLDGAQPPHSDVETMAAEYVDAVRERQPDGPYLLGGECIGGAVAFEMARQLRARGHGVAQLVLLNSFLTDGRRDARQTYRARQSRRMRDHARHLRALQPRQQLAEVGRRIHRLQRRLLPLTRAQRRERHIHRVRATYQRLLTSHRPRAQYPGPLVLLVTADDYRESAFEGWTDLAAGGVVMDKIPGTHESYLSTNATTTAARLGECLEATSHSVDERQ